MPKKFNIHDYVSPFEQHVNCDRCGNVGVNQYEDGKLCLQCAHDDVFEVKPSIWQTVNTSNTENTRDIQAIKSKDFDKVMTMIPIPPSSQSIKEGHDPVRIIRTDNLDEIVNKAIPISFPGVKCAATLNTEREKALIRRAQLRQQILTLLEKSNVGDTANAQLRMDTGTE